MSDNHNDQDAATLDNVVENLRKLAVQAEDAGVIQAPKIAATFAQRTWWVLKELVGQGRAQAAQAAELAARLEALEKAVAVLVDDAAGDPLPPLAPADPVRLAAPAPALEPTPHELAPAVQGAS